MSSTKKIMSLAGMDMNMFGPDSTRGASTSKASLSMSVVYIM